MTYTYRVTYLIGAIDTANCPPAILWALFPGYDGSQLTIVDQSEITVTFATPQTPVDLGPLVKVEIVPSL
jgi:hypothetical protein